MDPETQQEIKSEQLSEKELNSVVNKSKLSQERSKAQSLNDGFKSDEFETNGVTLIEDIFGVYCDDDGTEHIVKRFTWSNKNKIQVQAINYGARVISIKLPDRKGEIEDVLLGFDDLAGYLFYGKFYFGAVLGRISNCIKKGTFAIGKEKFNVNPNREGHCYNGGNKGLDKVIWETYVSEKKVIMSHISPHLTEGFPGDLLVNVVFELSSKNEFKVNLTAQTTQPTCVDLSHLLYFNLAGHHSGPDEIYRHILTLNCNCFTPHVKKIPTGEILNVIHTQYDFQIPKLLGKVIGVSPRDGFNQNLCINRAMYQDDCFVGRILHPPSGRMLEIYSNQPGVQLNTANEFGYGNVLTIEEIIHGSKTRGSKKSLEKVDRSMSLFEKVHEKIADLLKLDKEQNFEEIQELILKFKSIKSEEHNKSIEELLEKGLVITPMQHEYLIKCREVMCDYNEPDDNCLDLKEAISRVLKIVRVEEEILVKNPSVNANEELNGTSSKLGSVLSIEEKVPAKQEDSKEKINGQNSSRVKSFLDSKTDTTRVKNQKESFNKTPSYYQSTEKIRGKSRALYKMHGAISLKTQNYPNAINLKNFPNCVLNPGEVYKHNIIYRFWVRAGNPNKWIKRNLNVTNQKK